MFHVIVATKEKSCFDFLSNLLLQSPHISSVELSASGTECLNLVSQRKKNLVMTDIFLDEMGGISLSKEIKSRFPDVPLIGINCQKKQVFNDAFYIMGAQAVIDQKLNAQDLATMISNIAKKEEAQSCERMKAFIRMNRPSIDSEGLDQLNEDEITRLYKQVVVLS